MRLRSRLLLLVSAVVAPAMLAGGIALAYVYAEERAFHRESMQETARALALSLDREMTRREAVLSTLAASLSLSLGELDRFHRHAVEVAQRTDSAIILSDLDGRQIVNTRLPYGKRLPGMLPAERQMRARLGNEITLISDLYEPPAGLGPHSFAIQVPVRRDGKVVQFLTMASVAAQMQKLLAEQNLPAGWHATIVDRQGVIAARSLEPEKFVGQQVRDRLLARISAETEGLSEGVSLSGVEGTAFFSRAPTSGWTFLLTVPHSALYGPARRATVLLAGISLVLLGVGVGAASLVARRIAQPVEALREAARHLGHSEPVQPQSTGTLDLDEVSRAMGEASERLRGASAELERRVAQALASYEESQRALLHAQKLEALGRLTGGIAHDFNNVLQTLTSGLQALKPRVPEDRQELLGSCQRAVARGTELARQLMAFGRVQAVRAQTIDIAARLTDAQSLFRGALPANIAFDYDLPSALWPVTVDPAQLELAVLNLVINARDAMPSGGRVLLQGRNHALRPSPELLDGEYVVLTLADNGQGMNEDVQARALDPFYTTKGIGKGSGMGLPQAYGFARQSGGTLRLESHPGAGTTVTLYLPRARQPVADEAPGGKPASAATGRGRILLVEDDPHARGTVSVALLGAGFDVHTAETADEAMRRIDGGERYDAVLTDIVMPGRLSGLDLAERLRARYPGMGVVVATGYSDRAVNLPGVRALAKPYDVEEAVEALNAALEPSR